MKMSKKAIQIPRLISGGLITNYYCTSTCRHCLYGCSPRWEKKYVLKSTATRMLEIISGMGCRSIHIGGGDPFLNAAGLIDVLDAATAVGVGVDYVETNSSWYTNHHDTVALLREMRRSGLGRLLISISPFHNEYIPFYKVKGVMAACRDAGIDVFPWVAEFFPEIDSFDDRRSHRLEEYERAFGSDYLERIPSRYWIHFGGRALGTFSSSMPVYSPEDICSRNAIGCGELCDTSHFHADLFGNYIPGLCSGLAIRMEDLPTPVSRTGYPILNLLYTEGIAGLYAMAKKNTSLRPRTAT